MRQNRRLRAKFFSGAPWTLPPRPARIMPSGPTAQVTLSELGWAAASARYRRSARMSESGSQSHQNDQKGEPMRLAAIAGIVLRPRPLHSSATA